MNLALNYLTFMCAVVSCYAQWNRPMRPGPRSSNAWRNPRIFHLLEQTTISPEDIESPFNGNERIKLDVVNHQPCTQKRGRNENIRLPNHFQSPMVEVIGKPGCYAIRGVTEVYKPISSDLQMYVELRHRPEEHKFAPEPCKRFKNATKSNDECGGYGSCVYCQGCETSEQYKQTLKLADVQVTKDGEPLKCGQTIEPGEHDVGLRFCLPSKNEYIKELGEDQAYKRFAEIAEQLNGSDKVQRIFVKIYVFDFPVAGYFKQSERFAAERLRINAKNGKVQSQLDVDEHNRLPFSRFVQYNKLYIACHAFHGIVDTTKESS